MESIFDGLLVEIEEGIKGKNKSISVGLPKLGKYVDIKKNMLTLIFSSTGGGKSAYIDTIILNACRNYLDNGGMKPDFQLFSMERASKLRVAKWLCTLIFINEGVEIQLPKMMGWWDDKLSKVEHDLILKQKEYIDAITNDLVTIHDGAKTPNEIYKIMKDHYEEIGAYEEITEKGKTKKIYHQNDENIITIPIFDHGNLTKTTKELSTKKQAIDKLVEFAQIFRDQHNSNVIWVSQINRSITSLTRAKDDEYEPEISDVKESGDIGDACDVAVALFDPYRHKQSSKTGYSPSDFIDRKNGNNYFRSAHICKASYGADSVRIPLGFLGFCGKFVELEKRNDLSEKEHRELIDNILTKKYFLNNKE